jgi:hypothetical protein
MDATLIRKVSVSEARCASCRERDEREKAHDASAYMRGFMFIGEEGLPPLTIDVNVRRFVRSLDSDTGTYSVMAELDIRCRDCQSKPAELQMIGRLPASALQRLVNCECGTPMNVTITKLARKEIDAMTDRVTIEANAQCPACRRNEVVVTRSRIDIDEIARAAGATGTVTGSEAVTNDPINAFICYSHKDEELKLQLQAHLSPLRRCGLLSTWSDRQIKPGTDWQKELSQNLLTADLVLVLVSPDLIDSEYAYGKEVAVALERHAAGLSKVVPVILRPVLYEKTPIGRLQALPKDGKPVVTWSSMDEAFLDIARGLCDLIAT